MADEGQIAEPPVVPPATPPTTTEPPALDKNAFAQIKLAEGAKRNLKLAINHAGLPDDHGIETPEQLVDYFNGQIEKARKTDETTEQVRTQLSEQIKLSKTDNDNLRDEISGLKFDQTITDGLTALNLTVKDPKYLKYKIKQDYTLKDGVFTGPDNKQVLTSEGDFADMAGLIKKLSIDNDTKSLFTVPDVIKGTDPGQSQMSMDQMKSKLRSPEFQKKMKEQGLWDDYRAAQGEEAVRAVLVQVKE